MGRRRLKSPQKSLPSLCTFIAFICTSTAHHLVFTILCFDCSSLFLSLSIYITYTHTHTHTDNNMDKPTPTPTPVVRAPSMAASSYEGDGKNAHPIHRPRLHTTTLTRKISSKDTGLSHHGHLLLGQTAAAVIASSFVSPAMTIIDLSM